MIWNRFSIVRAAIIIFLLPALAVGCGWFGKNQPEEKDPNDYLQAKPVADLRVPADLPSKPGLDPFPVPEIPPQTNPSFYPQRPPLPDAMYANDNRNEVRIQRLGGRAWLAITEPPTTAWPKIKQFFADNGVAFASEDPEEGRLNTVWLALDSEGYRDVVRATMLGVKQAEGLVNGKDRLLIRVEQGLQPTATEVHLRHDNDQQGIQVTGDVTSLSSITSDSNDAENKLLSEIGAYIAARVAESTVSRVAQEIGSGAKTELIRNADGQPHHGFCVHIAPRSRRHVVQHNRHCRSRRYRFVMLIQTLLGGPVVIGRHQQTSISAEALRLLSLVQRFVCRITASARNYRNAPSDDVYGALDDLQVFVSRQSSTLTGRTHRHDTVRTAFYMPLDQPI